PKQLFKTVSIRLEGHTARGVHLQIRPYVMNGVDLVVADNLLKQQFRPGWNTGHATDIPFRRMPGNFVHTFIPCRCSGNPGARLIKAPKPKRYICGGNTADFSLQKFAVLL